MTKNFKILVCFKVTYNFDELSDEEWTLGNNNDVDTTYLKPIINPFDESALELALRLKDSLNTSADDFATVDVVTVGDSYTDVSLKLLNALKVENAFKIASNDTFSFYPKIKAQLLAQFAKNKEYDLIIMGRQGNKAGSEQVALLTSEILKIPCITNAIDISSSNGDIIVQNSSDTQIMQKRIQKKAVISIGNAPISCLRVPTIKDKLSFGKREIQTIDINALLSEEQKKSLKTELQIIDMKSIDRSRKSVIIGSERADIEMLVSKYIKPWIK